MAYRNILEKIRATPLAPEIDRLIKDREEARRNKDWERADTVRDELAQKGFGTVDTPTFTSNLVGLLTPMTFNPLYPGSPALRA